jgi:hypothetical protein
MVLDQQLVMTSTLRGRQETHRSTAHRKWQQLVAHMRVLRSLESWYTSGDEFDFCHHPDLEFFSVWSGFGASNQKGPASARPSSLLPVGSHIWIVRSIAALWCCPRDILAWVFDVASFTMHAVLEINLELSVCPSPRKLVDTCGAVPR